MTRNQVMRRTKFLIGAAFLAMACQASWVHASSETATASDAKNPPAVPAKKGERDPRDTPPEKNKVGVAAKGGAPQACSPSKYSGYVPSSAACSCMPVWSYNGNTYCNQQCADPAGEGTPWCYTQKTCNGNTWTYCAAPASKPSLQK